MQNGATALKFAAEYGHSEIVSVLVKAHAKVNLPNKVIHLSYDNTELLSSSSTCGCRSHDWRSH